MVGGPSIVFRREAVVNETHIRNSKNVCKSIVGIDASKLFPYSVCQTMPRGLYTSYEFDADLQRIKPGQNKSRNFENLVQCRWVLWSLQPNVWSSGLYLTLLSWSRGTTCCFWRRHSTWNKKEGNGWNAEPAYRGGRFHCCRKVGMWRTETPQDWCVSKERLERIIPIQASIASGPIITQDEIIRIVWLRKALYQIFRTSEGKYFETTASFQNQKTFVDKILVH